jgi:phosphoribosylformylglycinamidine cyclo-ligase
VDITKGNKTKQQIKSIVRRTFNKNVLSDIGHFGGFYDITRPICRQPVLVSSMDGVGTKIKVAIMMKRHDTVGEDLVNHSVNDILCCGAAPLFFLDYIAYSKLPDLVVPDIVKGLAEGCRKNGCALIGGETAQMPGMYQPGEYDLAGAIIGIVEKNKVIDGKSIRKGDVMIALPSSGLHTNGFSLARQALFPRFKINQRIPMLNSSLGEALLCVHRSYLKPVTAVMKQLTVKGLSHITGGGIIENTMRILPKPRRMGVDWNSWQRPMIFEIIQTAGQVPEADMVRSMNLGVGMILILAPNDADKAVSILRAQKEKPWILGDIH